MAKRRTAIYEPPKAGFPFLVVVIEGDEVVTLTASSRQQAREIAALQADRTPPKALRTSRSADIQLVAASFVISTAGAMSAVAQSRHGPGDVQIPLSDQDQTNASSCSAAQTM